MDLRRLDLNLLLVFEALHHERSVTRAAERMGVRQPAMSEALNRMRVAFDDPLFVRVGSGMQPTPRAEALAEGLLAALEGLRTTLGEGLAFRAQAAERSFTIGSTDYTSAVLLPPLMARLRSEAPGVDLRVVGYEKDAAPQMLERGEIDLALGVFPAPPDRLVRAPLFEERFIGVARRGHPALEGEPLDARAYAALPHALVSVRRDTTGALDAELAASGLTRRIVLVTPHMAALSDVIAVTDLVAALPYRLAAALDARLIRFDLPIPSPTWRIDMLWSPTSRRDQACGWLRSLVVDVSRRLCAGSRVRRC